jgi:hypothetical protein
MSAIQLKLKAIADEYQQSLHQRVYDATVNEINTQTLEAANHGRYSWKYMFYPAPAIELAIERSNIPYREVPRPGSEFREIEFYWD